MRNVWSVPYEKDRMIPQTLGKTAMGRDLLAQDYILKQLTASLIYPQKALGKTFWQKVYSKAKEMYGTTQVPVNTFNKVWIVPQKAGVYEHGQTAFIVSGHLKVMLEEDYLSLEKHSAISPSLVKEGVRGSSQNIHSLGSQIIRQIILPEIEKEINEGKNFATLRQIFYAQVLAVWFKRNLKQALLNRVYANKNIVKGIERVIASAAKSAFGEISPIQRIGGQSQQDLSPEQIYHQYLRAYKKGVFNFIQEDPIMSSPNTNGLSSPNASIGDPGHATIARKYFSGGYANLDQLSIDPAKLTDSAMANIKHDIDFTVLAASPKDAAMLNNAQRPDVVITRRLRFGRNFYNKLSDIKRILKAIEYTVNGMEDLKSKPIRKSGRSFFQSIEYNSVSSNPLNKVQLTERYNGGIYQNLGRLRFNWIVSNERQYREKFNNLQNRLRQDAHEIRGLVRSIDLSHQDAAMRGVTPDKINSLVKYLNNFFARFPRKLNEDIVFKSIAEMNGTSFAGSFIEAPEDGFYIKDDDVIGGKLLDEYIIWPNINVSKLIAGLRNGTKWNIYIKGDEWEELEDEASKILNAAMTAEGIRKQMKSKVSYPDSLSPSEMVSIAVHPSKAMTRRNFLTRIGVAVGLGALKYTASVALLPFDLEGQSATVPVIARGTEQWNKVQAFIKRALDDPFMNQPQNLKYLNAIKAFQRISQNRSLLLQGDKGLGFTQINPDQTVGGVGVNLDYVNKLLAKPSASRESAIDRELAYCILLKEGKTVLEIESHRAFYQKTRELKEKDLKKYIARKVETEAVGYRLMLDYLYDSNPVMDLLRVIISMYNAETDKQIKAYLFFIAQLLRTRSLSYLNNPELPFKATVLWFTVVPHLDPKEFQFLQQMAGPQAMTVLANGTFIRTPSLLKPFEFLSDFSDRAMINLTKDAAMTANGGIDLSQQDAALRVEKDANGGVMVNVDPALIARIEREGMSEVDPVIINMRPADVQSLFGAEASI